MPFDLVNGVFPAGVTLGSKAVDPQCGSVILSCDDSSSVIRLTRPGARFSGKGSKFDCRAGLNFHLHRFVETVATLACRHPHFDITTPAVIFEAVGVPDVIDTSCAGHRWAVGSLWRGCMQSDPQPFFPIAKEINV